MMAEMSSKKGRSANWSEREKLVLMESVRVREGVLFGKLSGSAGCVGISSKSKEREWEEVTSAVNAVGIDIRSTHQIKKQYDNIKQRAKGKLDELKRPKTGGGPAPEPSPSEQLFIDSHDGRPSIVGLETSLDTEDDNFDKNVSFRTKSVNLTEEEEDDTLLSESCAGTTDRIIPTDITRKQKIHALRKEIEGPNYIQSTSERLEKKQRHNYSTNSRNKRDQLEEELLQLEIKRVKLEIELLAMKKEKTRIKTEIAIEKKENLINRNFPSIQSFDTCIVPLYNENPES